MLRGERDHLGPEARRSSGALAGAGVELRVTDITGFVEATRVLPFVHRESRIPVDVVLAGPGLVGIVSERAADRGGPIHYLAGLGWALLAGGADL